MSKMSLALIPYLSSWGLWIIQTGLLAKISWFLDQKIVYLDKKKAQKLFYKCLLEVLDCNGGGPGHVFEGNIGLEGDNW